MADTQWDEFAADFGSGSWIHDFCHTPFLEAKVKRFAEARGGAAWAVLDVGCGMGKHSLRVLRAGASYVLAFDVSENMVEGAKMAMGKLLHSYSIPGAHEGTFDLAICVYVMCNLLSKEEVKQALGEIYKMLKPGGKLILYESHILKYMQWDDTPNIPLLYKLGWGTPKEDGTKWGYFEDEGKPREVILRTNNEREVKVINRFYTLSSWMSWILEAGFQITEFKEPCVDPKSVPADAPEYAKFGAGKPMGMCWECTKPLSQ